MKRKLAKVVMKLYAAIRPFASSVLWRLFYLKQNKKLLVEKPHGYDAVYRALFRNVTGGSLDIESFELFLNKFPYKPDRLWGALDASIPKKYAHMFVYDLKYGRDCDDFARMWSLWGEANGYNPREWLIYDPKAGIKKAHVVTTLSRGKEHWLMDKKPYGPHQSIDSALATLGVKYKEPIIMEYKWRREW